ncbi:ABC-type transport auxiliary lipoprotein family protein [Sulfurovum sp.]|uniref:ABC-type transport auxiliary lipoprotein family protein n=1 Tax=Sulfurovum sp. TaxID=1969726 RepID=UPI0025FB5353|nr:ABC-type transport auxiliary lipoprotein family protein [Sulfurovum sp.]
MPPLKIYTLSIESVAAVPHSKYRNQTIKVSFPQTLKEKISNRMSYSYSSREQGVYQNSQWSNNIGKLIQGSIIRTLDDSRIFKAALPYESTAGEDLRLESSIFDFSHHVRGNASYAIVSIQFSLVDSDTGKLIKTKRFSYREDTQSTNAKGYVEATNKAVDRLMKDLLRWLQL